MPFAPGQSGNPSGRPKVEGRVRELARQHTDAAIARLVLALEDDNARTAVAAAEALLDRGWGRAPQAVAGADGEGPAELLIRWAISQKS